MVALRFAVWHPTETTVLAPPRRLAMATAEAGTGAPTVEVDLGGTRAVPLRIAVGVLSLGPWLWAALAVVAPLAVLTSQLLWPTRPPMVVFLPGFLLFTLYMTPIRYARSRTTIDPGAGAVRIARPTGTGEETEDVHDLDAVERVEIQRLGSIGLVYLRTGSSAASYPQFVAPASALPAVVDAFRDGGLAVVEFDVFQPTDWRGSGPATRLVSTPLVVLGVPLVGVWWFGPGILAGSLGGLLLLFGATLVGGGLLRRLIAR